MTFGLIYIQVRFLLKVVFAVIIAAWLLRNVAVALTVSLYDMKQRYIKNQCLIGKVVANTFYFPAWILKYIKYLVA